MLRNEESWLIFDQIRTAVTVRCGGDVNNPCGVLLTCRSVGSEHRTVVQHLLCRTADDQKIPAGGAAGQQQRHS